MLISFAGIVLIAGQPSLSEQLPAILLTAAGAMTWAVGQIMVKRLENPPSGFALTAWIGVFSGPQMILGSFIFEDSQSVGIAFKCKLDWLGSDSVPGFDHDCFGLWDLVSCSLPQSCLKGYACNAVASCLHNCLKYAFSWRRTLAHDFHWCSSGYRWSLYDRNN